MPENKANAFTEYQVVERYDVSELVAAVTELLSEGWALIGGVAIDASENYLRLYQAMARGGRSDG